MGGLLFILRLSRSKGQALQSGSPSRVEGRSRAPSTPTATSQDRGAFNELGDAGYKLPKVKDTPPPPPKISDALRQPSSSPAGMHFFAPHADHSARGRSTAGVLRPRADQSNHTGAPRPKRRRHAPGGERERD